MEKWKNGCYFHDKYASKDMMSDGLFSYIGQTTHKFICYAIANGKYSTLLSLSCCASVGLVFHPPTFLLSVEKSIFRIPLLLRPLAHFIPLRLFSTYFLLLLAIHLYLFVKILLCDAPSFILSFSPALCFTFSHFPSFPLFLYFPPTAALSNFPVGLIYEPYHQRCCLTVITIYIHRVLYDGKGHLLSQHWSVIAFPSALMMQWKLDG